VKYFLATLRGAHAFLPVLALLLAGCAQKAGFPGGWSTIGNASANYGEEESGTREKSPAQLQLEVMDFSDRFVAATWSALDGILAGEEDPVRRAAILSWKVRYSSAAMEIGSGADPRTSLLDMAIFVAAGRWALDEYWIPEIFGPAGVRLQPVYADLETRIWDLVGRKLLPAQVDLLRDLITQWTKETPPGYEVSLVRFRNLEGVRAADFQSPRNARGLLASVRSWLGEVNTSLLLGERIIFYLERTPRLLAQQTDLTLAQIGENFPLATVQPDLSALAGYIEQLPARMLENFSESWPAEEGEPWLNEDFISGTLGETRALVADSTGLVAGATGLVGATTELSAELQRTLQELKDLGDRLQWNEIKLEEWGPRLTEVAASLTSLQSTVQGLQLLMETGEDGLTPAGRLLSDTESGISKVIDLIFIRSLILVAAVFLCACAWLVLARLPGAKKQKPQSGS
jgi:hypothetical protein